MNEGDNNLNEKKPIKSDTTGSVAELESMRQDGVVDTLEGLLDTGRADPQDQPAETAEPPALLATLIALAKSCKVRIDEIARDIERLKTDDKVLTEMSVECRELRERHHERNVLIPVFLTLIGVADRCRQSAGRLRTLLEKYADSPAAPVLHAIRHILDARNADRIDAENLLADYGVEPFVHIGDAFDPAVQKCIRREPCDNNAFDGHVAEGLLPGYRRFDKIIRQEYVSVYETGGRDGCLNRGE